MASHEHHGNGAEALVGTLAAEGVTYFFGIPGEHCLAIVDAAAQHDRLRFISVRHESAAAFMAEAYGKFTGRPAACVGTASVGGSNLLAGVNVAHHDSTPMVTLIGQVANAYRGREAWQEIDLVDVFDPVCRFAVEVTHPEKLPEVTRRAVALSQAGRPGPVMLSVPVDVQDDAGPNVPDPTSPVRRPGVDEAAIEDVVSLLRGAERPLLVVGGGIRASGARDDLIQLAESLQIPVVTAFRRTDAFPNNSSSYVGSLGLAVSESVSQTVREADVLVVIGSRLAEITTGHYAFPAGDQRTVHIDVDPRILASQWAPAEIRLTADARLAIQSLLRACVHDGVQWTEQWWKGHQAQGTGAMQQEELPAALALTRQVAAQIDQLLPDDGVVTSDAGDFFLGCAPVIRFHGERRYLGATSGTMGYGLPAAIAAKLAAPDRTCVALCGDGGLMMSVQEIETAVRYGIPVVVVVFNNNAYGSIVRHQQARFDGRLVGTALGNPPFAELAQLFGARGSRVSTADEFTAVFKQAVGSDRVEIIEVLL